MKTYEQAIERQYGRSSLGAELLGALESAGKDLDRLRPADTAAFDEFHIGGKKATRELAKLAGVVEGMKVLDVGAGIGGPARTLAGEFGARVTALDLSDSYARAGATLTRWLDLDDRVTFRQGNALAMPFTAKETFDLVWLQHALVNIQDKARLFAEVARVLNDGGRIAFHELLEGSSGRKPYFPLPWADGDSLSFLADRAELHGILEELEFRRVAWKDVTRSSLTWFRKAAERMEAAAGDGNGGLELNLLLGPSTVKKARNAVRSLEEGRVRVVYGVYKLPDPPEED